MPLPFFAVLPPERGKPIAATPPVATLAIRADDRVPIVHAVVKGKHIWFGLDTGATGDVLDAATAHDLGVGITGATTVSGPGNGAEDAAYLEDYSVGLGTARYPSSNALAIDLDRGGIPSEVRGVLGFPFFERYVVDVDYVHHVVRLYDPKTFVYRGGGAAVSLTFADREAFVAVTVSIPGTSRQRHILVDTGSSAEVNDDLVLHVGGPKTHLRSAGVGTPRDEVQGTLSAVKIGPYVLKDVDSAGGARARVGSGLWMRFHAVWNFSRSVVYLEPN